METPKFRPLPVNLVSSRAQITQSFCFSLLHKEAAGPLRHLRSHETSVYGFMGNWISPEANTEVWEGGTQKAGTSIDWQVLPSYFASKGGSSPQPHKTSTYSGHTARGEEGPVSVALIHHFTSVLATRSSASNSPTVAHATREMLSLHRGGDVSWIEAERTNKPVGLTSCLSVLRQKVTVPLLLAHV